MPRRLKRRSEVLDEEAEDASDTSPPPRPQASRRNGPRTATPPSNHSPRSATGTPTSDEQTPPPESSPSTTALQPLIKKLVRLALSTEYARTPLRRADITMKCLADAPRNSFKLVFAGAQALLREVFGMQLVELPGREKTSLKDRRAQATQAAHASARVNGGGGTGAGETQRSAQAGGGGGAGNNNSSNKSWILISILPPAYKTNPSILQPSLAPSSAAESTYTALYTFVVSLIYLSANALPDNTLHRYLGRVNLEQFSPLEGVSTEKLMARMAREGYVERRREMVQGEEEVSWVVGPRGRVEVGERGVVGLVRLVNGVVPGRGGGGEDEDADAEEEGDGDGDERPRPRRRRRDDAGEDGLEVDLDTRLMRSLGLKSLDLGNARGGMANGVAAAPGVTAGGAADEMDVDTQPPPRRRGRPRRNRDDDDDDDDY